MAKYDFIDGDRIRKAHSVKRIDWQKMAQEYPRLSLS